MYNLIFLSSSTIFYLIFILVIPFFMFQASPPNLTPHFLREEDLVPLPPELFQRQAVVWGPAQAPFLPAAWGPTSTPGSEDNPILVPDTGSGSQEPIDLTQEPNSREGSPMEGLVNGLENLELN
jgi:hypothetical protein